MKQFSTREEWLQSLVTILRPRLDSLGYGLPDLLISCGWPSTRALSAKRRRIGECWSHKATESGIIQIFISPVLSDPLEVAETVVHELGHASLGSDVGHKAPFKAFMKAVGLTGKATATVAGAELKDYLGKILPDLGAYPNSRLDKLERPTKKQTTRMRKAACSVDHEPYILRGSKETFSRGIPVCPLCDHDMVLEEPEEEEGE